MAVTATRKTYDVKYQLFDGPEDIPALIALAVDQGYRASVSAQIVDGEPEYWFTASRPGETDGARASRVSVTVGEVVVNDGGSLSQRDAEGFLDRYDPPADKVSKLEAVRDAKLAAIAAAEAAAAAAEAEKEGKDDTPVDDPVIDDEQPSQVKGG